MFGIEFVKSNDGYFAFSGLALSGPGPQGDALGYYIASLWD
jgi:hypothetical protein